MKKLTAIVLVFACALVLVCCGSGTPKRTKTVEADFRTYYELNDGTWECEGHIYKYRLEIKGRMHSAAVDSTFVYLSNIESISFDRAWKAAGLSSNTDDYFLPEEAVLVDTVLG